MESGNGGASRKGVLVPVSESSDVFQNCILGPLKSAYLYEESKQSFRYKSAVIIENPVLEEKYNAFRAKRREVGYSEEDLKESYGFLLFEDASKANALGETGVLTGNSTCTTLGDPSNGVYISMYSDCLDLNRWYHGKSGYIAIIRLTKGRVKKVLENYTQNLTTPTVGFDCHVSEQLPSVSAKTSSFLAFERTQYYMYELLDDGSNKTSQSPSAACPFAIVSFSYTDTKATLVALPEKSEEKKRVCHYFPWRGQLQIGTQLYNVELRSTGGALIPAELPPVVKVDRVISMLDLRQLLPRAVFDSCFTGEVCLDGLYCSLFELVSFEAGETNTLTQLLLEIKEKDVAFTVLLNDGGFLILLHTSHFLTYEDTGFSAADVLQVIFVFPESRQLQRVTKLGQKTLALSSEVLRVLPVLSYAEGEVEKTVIDPNEQLCEILVQHMQSYAALIDPGLALSPSRDVSIFPDQYDVPEAHKHLYSTPEWSNKGWQSFRSYLSNPGSYQLPMSRASEILAAGQDERIEDLDDDVYICLSSPEQAPASPVSMGTEDQLTDQKSPVNVETPADSCITHAEAPVDLTLVAQNVPDVLQTGDGTKDIEKSHRTVLKGNDTGAKNILTPSTSDDLPTELIVSITSAERTVTDQRVITPESATKHNDFQLSGFTTTKLEMAGVNSLNDETVKTKKVLDCPGIASLTKRQHRKPCKRRFKGRKKACVETSVKIPVKDNNLNSQKDDQAKESSDHLLLNIPSNIDCRKLQRPKHKFGKFLSKCKKLRSAAVGQAEAEEKSDPGQQNSESTIFTELEACPLRKKTERWDLKPIISTCGKILVPFGSVDFADQVKSLKDKLQSTNSEQCLEKRLFGASLNAHEVVKMEQESCSTPETAVDETEATSSKDGGNHLQNIVAGHMNPEHKILRQSDNGSSSVTSNPASSKHSSKDDDIDSPVSESTQEKHIDTLSPGKCATKGEFLLSKLKSVLLRGKRKAALLVSEETDMENAVQDSTPCFKMGKVDSDTGMSSDQLISVQDTNMDVKEVSKMPSVDPLFAYALGLTPKRTPEKTQKTEGQDTQQVKDSSEIHEQTTSDKQSQIIQRPPSIFPRRGRIKTLKKHQGISTEHVKKKWWLHFQTPACFASEKLKYTECSRDNSVRKTVEEKTNSACSSTDALNLLADLALSASNDQVPPQPDPALERKPETSLKKSDLTNDVTSGEQKSVLHALLKQPAARPIQPLESPSPSHLVGGSELGGLISKEHAYSLPPSSSLLLGLSGTLFQVSPLSGSTRLLHHQKSLYGDGIQIQHSSDSQEDRSEYNWTSEYLKKRTVRRRKLRHCRTFVNKDGSVQVTKQWKENYDFDLDSKFTSDPRDRAIIRALHGPWDCSIQDTNEEVRLIFHMWIGLFYSRSTARFFHVDSNLTYPCSEGDPSEVPGGIGAVSELKTSSFSSFPSVTDTSDTSISKALDLSKKDESVMDQEFVVLDLSLRNSNAEDGTSHPEVNRKETSVSDELEESSETLNTLMGLPGTSTSQCSRKTVDTEIINEASDVRDTSINNRTCSSSQRDGHLEHTDLLSCKGDGTLVHVEEKMGSVFIQPENNKTVSGSGHMLHECNNEKANIKDGIVNAKAVEIAFVEMSESDSSEPVTDEEVDARKEEGDVVHTVEYDETESKDGGNCETKEKASRGGNIEMNPKRIHTDTESDPVCNGNVLEDEKQLSREELKADSPGKAENVNEDVDLHEGKVIEDDHSGNGDELYEKNSCVTAVEPDNDVKDQPLSIMCNGPDLVKKDSITECHRQTPLHEQTPQEDDNEEDSSNIQLGKLHANGSAAPDEHAIAGKAPRIPLKMEPFSNVSAVEDISQNDICSVDKPHCQKAAILLSDKSTCSLDGSCADGSIPQTNHSVETRSQNKLIENFNLRGKDHDDGDTKLDEAEKKFDVTTQNELLQHQTHSPHCEVIKTFEVALMKGSDFKWDRTNEGLENIHSGVVIPFIGLDTSGEDAVQPDGTQSYSKIEEITKKEEIPFISETMHHEPVLSTESCRTSKICSKMEELSAGKIPPSLLDVCNNQPVVLESESDDRCPTPTMDEKPYEYFCNPSSGSGASALSGSETYENLTQKCQGRGSISVKYEIPLEEKLCHKSTFNSDPNPHHGLHPDLELRTLRVLQTIDKFFSNSGHTDTFSQIEKADMKHSPSSKNIPLCLASNYTSDGLEDKRVCSTKPVQVSGSTSEEMDSEPSSHFVIAPFKRKLEEVLNVKLKLKKTNPSVHQYTSLQENSVGQDYHNLHSSVLSSECFQDIKPNIYQDRPKTASQTNVSHETRSYTQRPVMAVKPSKSDESQADCTFKDRHIENRVMSKNKQTKTHNKFSDRTQSVKVNSEGRNDMQNEISSKSSLLSDGSDSDSYPYNTTFAPLDPLYQNEGRNNSKFNKIPSSSFTMHCLESAIRSSKPDGNQGFLTNTLIEKVGQTTTESSEMDWNDCSDASTSNVDYKVNSLGGSLPLGPQSSLTCTVFNNSRKESPSFLEQMSRRCLQDDLTQVSLEQECLIFSEQMKQLVKRSKKGPILQSNAQDKLQLSCKSPVTVHFSSLEELEDSVDDLEPRLLVGQKIKVDTSDRKALADTTQEEKTLNSQKLSQATGNPMEHAGVSSVTTDSAMLYEAMMDDVCAFRKVSSWPKYSRMDRGYRKTESNHFDFCDQMKREMDESFRSNLNSVVKKSCKTKYRFYIQQTSEDPFFEQTKVQLEAEGHTAVQPPDFFLGEDNSSSLLIILRNEDISEHICEIPHLLELKKSPSVQFAGIDEPDDVVNLTHQELFTRGGFVMLDRAALESLSLCNMEKMSEILQELSRTGKWKWILHYRDSRQLKENARLNVEAKEKKHFLNWCQETGILEVLPYHECDLVTKDQPDYVMCLTRLQVQNISARYPVFLTDADTDSAFGRNGILTMTVNSFLTCSPHETFRV